MTESSSFEIPKSWTFKSKNVATNFNSHVRESLPWYDMVTGFVVHFARNYIPESGVVYDIGASTGNIGKSIYNILHDRSAEFHAIEESKEMASVYEGPQKLHVCDALTHNFKPYDFAVCFLTLMFIPMSKRKSFLKMLVSKMKSGGALLVVDKTQGQDGYLGTVFSRLTMKQKLEAGIDSSQIIEKELSLSGYQRPIDHGLLGPEFVKFFQAGEFSGWIATKK